MTCPHQIPPKLKIREQKEGCHCFGPLSFGAVCYVTIGHLNHMVDYKWPHILYNSSHQEMESTSPALWGIWAGFDQQNRVEVVPHNLKGIATSTGTFLLPRDCHVEKWALLLDTGDRSSSQQPALTSRHVCEFILTHPDRSHLRGPRFLFYQ